MSVNNTFGLNLRVLSFDLSYSLYKDSDDIRVSITTLPDEQKQHFTISARKMKDCNLNFNVNVSIPQEKLPDGFISTSTEKIIIVFRKKSFFYNDPIIAATVIPVKELPQNLSVPAQTKVFDLFERSHNKEEPRKVNSNPFSQYQASSNTKNDRRIIGKVQVQLSLTDPFHLKDFSDNELYGISNHETTDDNENDYYMNDQFKLGENYFGFRVLKNNH